MKATGSVGVDWTAPTPPVVVNDILRDTRALGFTMACEPEVGALLATLAAGKPGGRALEIGTGTGVGTAWLLSGLNADARLVSVDNDPVVQAVAARHLGHDPRLTFVTADGGDWLSAQPAAGFDLIFADSWPGKYTHLDQAWPVSRRAASTSSMTCSRSRPGLQAMPLVCPASWRHLARAPISVRAD